MSRKPIDFDRPKLFSPSFTNRVLNSNGAVLQKNATDVVDTNIVNTSSFRYDANGTGIKSTQQLAVDFSKFETHTFFGSAEANVNIAFEKIINQYPFDGTRREVESFVDSLTGFEKWVLDNFPRNVGYLNFSGSSSPSSTEGTYITVNDYAGFLYPSISKKKTGDNVLDPGLSSFSIEMHVFIPQQANKNSVLCQKISGSYDGITLAISESASTSTCGVVFAVSSGSLILSASALVEKGRFNHVAAVLDRHPGINNVQLYINESLASTSTNVVELGNIGFKTSQFTIASGTSHESMHSISPSVAFTPTETFSGSIDEFRVFHSSRNIKQQQLYGKKSIFASDDLKLYFKFNEPTGSIGNDSLIIDSSGNSLHSVISNFTSQCRATGSIACPVTSEKLSLNPVLFPSFDGVQTLNTTLLYSASIYDSQNPNLITKLIPSHYFHEGQVFEGLKNENGTMSDNIEGSGGPGSADVGSSQLLSAFLYVWARFFDEIKMMVDSFGSVIHVDYDKPGCTADQFLQFLSKYYGFEMPAFFVDSSIEQFIDAENISSTVGTSTTSLQFVQNQLWRRILTNIGEVIRSKGTLHSIKALLLSMGIDPRSLKIREYGGPTFRNLENARENKQDIIALLDFSGSMSLNPAAVDSHGVSLSHPFMLSQPLSGSRVEPGYPAMVGAMVGIAPNVSASNNQSDGLLTSGSWTYEAIYKYRPLLSGSHAASQSLVRMSTTGSYTSLTGSGGLIVNITAVTGSGLTLYVSPGYGGVTHPLMILPLTGVDVMDGRLWNVSFGRQRADEAGSYVSSSYFLRAARQDYGSVVESYITSTYFNESGSAVGTQNVFEIASSQFNASGSFIAIGSQSIDQTSIFLNDQAIVAAARESTFDGAVAQIRFWSKALATDEWLEHVRNFKSVGVIDPKINFNFNNTSLGSFEKIRLDASMEQQITSSNVDGTFTIFDFSQNQKSLSCTGFEKSVDVTTQNRVFYSQLSPKFDEASSNEKVRIRSFIDYNNVLQLGGSVAPIYKIPNNELPNDDARFSIDFSIADALNEDIVKIFATFDELDNILGNPELIFSPDYPALENIRDVYFNRLTDHIRLKQFFEFFKWFDNVLGISTFIEQLIPRKTLFLGTNFVVESHMLERPKLEYSFTDIYLGEDSRHGLKGTILLQQFEALLRKF